MPRPALGLNEDDDEDEDDKAEQMATGNKRPLIMSHLCLFLFSFLITFSSLFVGSRILNAKLKEAGYDISRLILFGLEPRNTTNPNTMAFNTEYTQLIALAFTLASGAFIYFKFVSSSRCRVSFISLCITSRSRTETGPRPQTLAGVPLGKKARRVA